MLKFPCHFVAYKVAQIQGFVAGLGAVLQIRCTGKILINLKVVLQLYMLRDNGREIILTRYTEPEPELRLLVDRMKLVLPAQPPPKIAAAALPPQPVL